MGAIDRHLLKHAHYIPAQSAMQVAFARHDGIVIHVIVCRLSHLRRSWGMYTQAQAHLTAACPRLAALITRIGPRVAKPDDGRSPYAKLVRAIAHQQLNGRAAELIFSRFLGLFPGHDFPPPDLVLAHPEESLRGVGFSYGKIAAIRDIAAKTQGGVVPERAELAGLSDEEAIARLVAIRGVGRWTVEMLLMDMGRPDILPVDDFGVREGYRLLHGQDAQPKPKALAEIGAPWAPYRSTAAWYLWRVADEQKKIKPVAP
jgi:DNA-3-methyladenine glycosylase II